MIVIVWLCQTNKIQAQCSACEHSVQLIQNGNFSSGNSGFTTNLVPGTGFFCPLCTEGTYAIGPNALFYHNGFTGSDHTNPPSGNFFIANGAGYPNYQVWCQTVSVQPNTNYTFSMWTRDVANNPNPHPLAQLQVTFNGIASGPIHLAQGGWSNVQFVWNSGNLSSVQICVTNLQDQTGGNDFGLDDITLTACHAYHISHPANAGTDKSICSNESTILGSISYPGYSYLWNNPTGLSSTVVSNPLLLIQNSSQQISSQTYILTSDSANVGCISKDTVIVNVKPLPVFDLGENRQLCPGESAVLTAGSGWQSVQWHSDPFSFSSQEAQVSVNVEAMYYATVTLNDCSAEDSVNVQITDLPEIDLGPDVAFCEGNTYTLTSAVSGQWSTGSSGNQVEVSEGGEYSFLFTNNGCSVADTIRVTRYDYPVIIITGDLSMCEGQETTLISTVAGEWSNGTSGYSTTVNTDGNYSITAANGPCESTAGAEVSLLLMPFADTGRDTLVCDDQPIVISAYAAQNGHYLWSTGDTLPEITVHNPGIYSVIASNECGNVTSEVWIDMEACGWNIYIPDCITPNHDGINDAWQVEGYNFSDLEVRVYNRLGDMIFFSNTSEKSWVPNEKEGDDSYSFFVTGADNRGKKFERTGHILVLR
ncbi:MAG: gliding motility-associated C-terminal domain-containing protein [Crocinitomicaceae bacterium]|nr:gliding motility-associated C-terminal domain-containing protein [Crocinitomicaceae bacterium]